MAITYRPYAIPNTVDSLQDRLNELYDRGIDVFLRKITEAPWPEPALKISVTNRCNLSCTYCYDKNNQPPFQPPIDMEATVAAKIFEIYSNPSYVFVLGGEPFLNTPAVKAILDHAPSPVAISTNGQVANSQVDQILDKIVERNKQGRTTLLQVSCELGGTTVERDTRDPRHVEHNVSHFAHICGRYMKVKFTMTQPSVTDIGKIAQWYWDRNLPVQFDYADGGFDTGFPVDLPDEDRTTIFEFALETLQNSFSKWVQNESDSWSILHAKRLVNNVFPSVIRQIRHQHPIWSMCGILGHSLYVGSSGELFPCHRWKHTGQSYGILGENCTGKVAQFHYKIGPVMRDYCRTCIGRGTCGGICPAVVCTYGGDMLEGRCKFISALRDAVWSFLANDQILYHPRIDGYINEIVKHSSFQSML